eukprot:1829274-Ditylum_brightwellii.AAC.1
MCNFRRAIRSWPSWHHTVSTRTPCNASAQTGEAILSELENLELSLFMHVKWLLQQDYNNSVARNRDNGRTPNGRNTSFWIIENALQVN